MKESGPDEPLLILRHATKLYYHDAVARVS